MSEEELDPEEEFDHPIVVIDAKSYDFKQIEHVASAFFETVYSLRGVANAVRLLVSRHTAEQNSPDSRVVRWYRRRWRCDLTWIPDADALRTKISHARRAVQAPQARAALYVAEHGPLFQPFCRPETAARTVFDHVLDRVNQIADSLVMALPPEWDAANFEEWDGLKPRERMGRMFPVYLAARQLVYAPSITTDVQMKVDEMWECARIAHRLMTTLGPGHQPLLDGSLLVADIGCLAFASVNYAGTINDGYPIADEFPQDFIQPQDWRRYASLLQQAKVIAPKLGVTDSDTSDALCAAEQLALARYKLATKQCDGSVVDRVAAHHDPVEFSQAYWRIRHANSLRLKTLIPDRGKMWAEAFDKWAAGVSAEDMAVRTLTPQNALEKISDTRDDENNRPVVERIQTPDGPTEPKMFFWKNVKAELEPKPFALLKCMWAHPTASIPEVEITVWGDEAETDGRLKSAISRVNAAFLEVSCPKQLSKSANTLVLQ